MSLKMSHAVFEIGNEACGVVLRNDTRTLGRQCCYLNGLGQFHLITVGEYSCSVCGSLRFKGQPLLFNICILRKSPTDLVMVLHIS